MLRDVFDQKQILIVEDDREISELVKMHLRDLGCNITKSNNGAEGLDIAEHSNFDLIILDVILPGIDGLDICKKIRFEDKVTPILMLTARSEEIDKILGLELGADDYITKPFSIRELIARIKVLLRRMETFGVQSSHQNILRYGELVINVDNKSVMQGESRIKLTQKEFKLLMLMASHPGRSYSSSDLLDIIWGYQHSGYEHTVTAHINRLRNKIESDPSNPEYILTTWGLGYRFNDQLAFSGATS